MGIKPRWIGWLYVPRDLTCGTTSRVGACKNLRGRSHTYSTLSPNKINNTTRIIEKFKN